MKITIEGKEFNYFEKDMEFGASAHTFNRLFCGKIQINDEEGFNILENISFDDKLSEGIITKRYCKIDIPYSIINQKRIGWKKYVDELEEGILMGCYIRYVNDNTATLYYDAWQKLN